MTTCLYCGERVFPVEIKGQIIYPCYECGCDVEPDTHDKSGCFAVLIAAAFAAVWFLWMLWQK